MSQFMSIRRRTYIIFATSSLLLGSTIYILFRSKSLLMFRWISAYGLMSVVNALRSHAQIIRTLLPGWFIYSLPFALWIISYLFFVRAIWFKSKSASRNSWFWCIPLISIAAELGQYPRIVPGTFDVFDLLTIGIAAATVFTIAALDTRKPTKETT